ncbi:MAG: recombinase family protein [Patescibacteria group bacterium]
MKEKAVIYARVSSKEQEETGYSLPAQEKLLEEHAQRKDMKVVKTFSVAESASGAKQRKVFSDMIDYMTKNGVNNLLCEKVDRLTRNLKEAVVANDWIDADVNRKIHFVKQNLVIHRNAKSDERFRWDIEIVLAKKYISNLSEEVRKGQKEKLSQGWAPVRAPLGYKSQGEKGHKIHVINPEKAQYIKRMFDLYSTGNYSVQELSNVLYKEGFRNNFGTRVGKTRMHDFLSDPFYYGKIRWNNEIYQGKHEPLISQELFNLVQDKLNRKNQSPSYRKHTPVFKAKLNCEVCKGVITWETQKGHWYGHCNYYKGCPKAKWIRQEEVEKELFAYFDKIAPKNPRVIAWLEKALKESHADEIQEHGLRKEEISRLIKRNDNRMEKVYMDKLDGAITGEMYTKVFEDTKRENEVLLDSLKKLSEDRQRYYEAGYSIHELAMKAKDIYLGPKTTVEQKRLLLSQIFSNISMKANVIAPQYTLAFEFLAKWVPLLNNTFEPENNGSIKRKESTFVPSRPTMLLG